jgi:hypothetical protein
LVLIWNLFSEEGHTAAFGLDIAAGQHAENNARLEVLKAVTMKINVCSNVIPCSLVDMYRRFGEKCYPSLQGRKLVITHKTAKSIFKTTLGPNQKVIYSHITTL